MRMLRAMSGVVSGTITRALPGILAAGLAGCQAAAPPNGPLGTEPATVEPPDPTARTMAQLRERMHVQFAATTRMQTSIALSDLPAAHAEARRLRTLDGLAPLPPAWQPHVEAIRAAARAVEQTRDPSAAAQATTQIARACAQCHRATNATIAFPDVPVPALDPTRAVTPGVTMASHHWAAARMWEGLIGPSDAQWNRGAQVLTEAPLTMVAEGELPGALGVADDVARVRLYATRALTTTTLDARATLYGDLLATCASCHHAIRDR